MKRIVFLGSSVTYGEASGGVSFADMLCEKYGYEMVKEAVSGTTLVDEGADSYVSRLRNITVNDADLFICQLSTNDATGRKPLGKIADSRDMNFFDTKTVAGAIEFIIAYAFEKWNCPVMFYTGPRYDSVLYEIMVKKLREIAEKWNISIIDLWGDEQFNSISTEKYNRYMADPIHPTLEGYREWWLPEFERATGGRFCDRQGRVMNENTNI